MNALRALNAGQMEQVVTILAPGLAAPPFSLAVRQVIIGAVRAIMFLEADRGEIARVERSALAPAAQVYQDLIDRLLFRMAGLTDGEARGVEERLGRML